MLIDWFDQRGGVNYESRELQEWDDSEESNCDEDPVRKPFQTVRPGWEALATMQAAEQGETNL